MGVQMDFNAVLSFGSFVVLGAVLWMIGQAAKAHVREKWSGWSREAFDRSIGFHAPMAALIAYQAPGFPLPEGWDTVTARVLLGLACGMSTSWSYKAFRRALGVDHA